MEKVKDLLPSKSHICCLPAPQATRNPKHQAAKLAQMEAFLNTWCNGQEKCQLEKGARGYGAERERSKTQREQMSLPSGMRPPIKSHYYFTSALQTDYTLEMYIQPPKWDSLFKNLAFCHTLSYLIIYSILYN